MNNAWVNNKHVGVDRNKQRSRRNRPLKLPPVGSAGKINLSSGKFNEPWVIKILQIKAKQCRSANNNEGIPAQ